MATSFIVASVAAPCFALALGIVAFRIAKKIHGGRVATLMRGSSRAAVTADRAGFSAAGVAMFVVATVVHVTFLVLFEMRH